MRRLKAMGIVKSFEPWEGWGESMGLPSMAPEHWCLKTESAKE